MITGSATLTINDDTLALDGVLDASTVLELRDRGREWLGGPAPAQARIDLAGVSYSSSAGIALLLAWWRAADRAGKRIAIVNLPAQMAALMRVGGLEELFGVVASAG